MGEIYSLTPKEVEEVVAYRTHRLNNGCWVWKGARRRGAPSFTYRYKCAEGKPLIPYYRHPARALWEIYNDRPLKDYEQLFATCGERNCLNPQHMEVANGRFGRHYTPNEAKKLKGNVYNKERIFSRLSLKQVDTIRFLLKEGKHNYAEIARQFGVSKNTIGYIAAGRIHKDDLNDIDF